MKKNLGKVKNLLCGIAGAAAITAANTMPVYAGVSSTGVPAVDTGMNVIKVVAIGIVEVVGVIVLVKGAMDLGSGISQRDQSGIVQGAGELGGGLLMAGVGALIGLLGF